jgi:hypothetical protein
MKSYIESQIEIEEVLSLCDDLKQELFSSEEYSTKIEELLSQMIPMYYVFSVKILPIIETIGACCQGYRDPENMFYKDDSTLLVVVITMKTELVNELNGLPSYFTAYVLLPSEIDFLEKDLLLDPQEFTKSLGGFLNMLKRLEKDSKNQETKTKIEVTRLAIENRNDNLHLPSKSIIRYKGRSDPYEVMRGKVYYALSRENGWYRIINEFYEDDCYLVENFEYLGQYENEYDIPLTEDETEFVKKYFFPKKGKFFFIDYIILLYRVSYARMNGTVGFETGHYYDDLCQRFYDRYQTDNLL